MFLSIWKDESGGGEGVGGGEGSRRHRYNDPVLKHHTGEG